MCDTELDVWIVGSKIGGIYYDGKHKDALNYLHHYHPNDKNVPDHPHLWYYN